MPTVIREFARAGAGEVSAVAAGVFGSGKLLTAVRNGSDVLELIVWAPDAAHRKLTRVSDSGTQAGEVGQIALAMMGERCVTAVQNGSGNLLLIPWALEPDGTISRLEYADAVAGEASYIALIRLSDSVLVTPCRNGAGNLLVIPWGVGGNGHISRLFRGPARGGSVANASANYRPLGGGLITVPLHGAMIAGVAIDDHNFVTAKVNMGGGLELATWALTTTNEPSRSWTSPVLETLADNLCMAPLGNPGQTRRFVLAYRRIVPAAGGQTISFNNEIVVSVWEASAATGQATWLGQASVDELDSISLAVASTGPGGRPVIFLSGRSGYDQLVNVALEVITDGSRLALAQSGEQQDDSYRYIGQIAPVALADGQVAATLGHEDGLGLVAYELSDLSATLLRPLAEATAGEATSIRVRALNASQAIAAMRNGSGRLELIAWNIGASSFAVTRAADTASNPIAASEVALVTRGRQAVTAIRDGSGNLRLDSWNVAADLSSIEWVHQTGTAAGGADRIAAVMLEPDLVVTALRNLSGNLLLIVWRLEADGTLSRLNHENAQAGEISLISLTALDASNVVTSVRDGSGNLLLIGWSIGSDGRVTRWRQDGHAGEVSVIASAVASGSGNSMNVITAVRDGSDGLLLIAWRASVGERTITRLADSGEQGHEDGDATNLSLCVCQSPPSLRATIITARRRASGSLKLTAWQLLDDPAGVPMLVETGDMTNRADLDVTLTDLCPLEPGRVLAGANVGMKHAKGLWLSTIKVSDARLAAAPAGILTLSGFVNPSPPDDPHWADGNNGDTYPSDKSLEWQQVLDPASEYDDTPVGLSGWVVKPEESGADVPFSHPFGFDYEFGIAVDKGFEGFISPANLNDEEGDSSPNTNGVVLADQLGLTAPAGLLGMEWEKDLLPRSYRGQVNHGDRVAILGRWILDNGHNIGGKYRTEIHPPLLVASANIVRGPRGAAPRTRALFISRPYLSGQTYTRNLGTRYQDGVDDEGFLLHPHFSSYGFWELVRVLTGQTTQLEAHTKIKEKPFRGNHGATFTVRAPGLPPRRDARLLVSYRFNVRAPCQVRLLPNGHDSVDVRIDLLEKTRDGRVYQAPGLPASRSETYSNDDLDRLSPGSGGELGLGEAFIEFATHSFLGGLYSLYLKWVFDKGIETDVFDPQPQFDILDPAGGVHDVPATQIVPGAGIVEGEQLAYPVTGWVEAYWSNPAGA